MMEKYFEKINLSNKRSDDETFDEYRQRLKKNKVSIKMHLKGEQILDSIKAGKYKKNKSEIS